MSKPISFHNAVPVWSAALAGRMNIWLSFHARVELAPGASATLRIAAAQAWRVWANGQFAGRGPARAAHGHARVDEWTLTGDGSGVMEVVVEVMGYGVATFCSTHEPAFLCAELITGKKVLAWTALRGGGFVAEHRRERVQKVERYSYQRAFVEGYRFAAQGPVWQLPGYHPAKPHLLARVKHRRVWLERGMALPDLSVLQPRAQAVRGTARKIATDFKFVPPWGFLFDVPKTSAGYRLDQLVWPLFKTLIGSRF